MNKEMITVSYMSLIYQVKHKKTLNLRLLIHIPKVTEKHILKIDHIPEL